MTFTQSIKFCLSRKNYFSWDGRASRSEYWYFVLFTVLVNVASWLVLDWVFPATSGKPTVLNTVINSCVAIAVGIPKTTALGRRLHDSDKSAWNVCWGFMPVLGLIINAVQACQRPTSGTNRFDAITPEQLGTYIYANRQNNRKMIGRVLISVLGVGLIAAGVYIIFL